MAIILQKNLFSWQEIETRSGLDKLKMVLEILPDEAIMQTLEKQRKNKRDDYPIRAIWNSVIAGIIYQHISIESLRRELLRNAELRQMCGFDVSKGELAVPSKYVYTRFFKKLIKLQYLVDEMFHQLIEDLTEYLPDLGEHLAIDGKAVQSNAVGKKESADSSDPDADWGKKEYKGVRADGSIWSKVKSWFGYNLHLLVDAKYELPLGYKVTKASRNDTKELLPIMEEYSKEHLELIERGKDLSADRGYDSEDNNRELYDKYGIKPIIDIRNMWKLEKDSEIKTRPLYEDRADLIVYDYKGTIYCRSGNSQDEEKNYTEMAFMGFEADRKCLKYRCPAAAYGFKCSNKSSCGTGNYSKFGRVVRTNIEKDRRIFTPVARSSYKFDELYNMRSSVERVNNRIDHVYGFEKHFIRGKTKITMKISLSLVIMLTMALGWLKQNQKENLRSLVKPLKKAA